VNGTYDPPVTSNPSVQLHVWCVGRAGIPAALGRMAWDHLLMKRSGASFWRLLGTADAAGFSWRDTDLRRWALLSCWPDERSAEAFENSATVRGWDRLAQERVRLRLQTLGTRGTWGGRRPFGPDRAAPSSSSGPVAAITRARLHPARTRSFRRAVPPVAVQLRHAPGLRLAMGVGEAPVGLQGTFSLWDDAAALTAFAYRGSAHTQVVRRTAPAGWYTEELFARFAVLEHEGGSVEGRLPRASDA